MKLVHIHMHFPWALLSLNLGQVFNPLAESEAAKLCLLGTAPRQMQKSSSFINTKLNLASQISTNEARKHFSLRWGRRKGEVIGMAGRRGVEFGLEVLQRPRSGTLFAEENSTHLTGYQHTSDHCQRFPKIRAVTS